MKRKNIRVLGLIPARGGSKGIPQKNIKLLNGKPLIEWSAEALLKSKLIDTWQFCFQKELYMHAHKTANTN